MSSQLRKYLSLSKKDWNAMVVLVILILLVLAAPYLYGYFHKDKPTDLSGFDKAAALLNKAQKADSISDIKKESNDDLPRKIFISNKLKPGATIELNSADSAALTRVHGIGGSFAIRIIRYRNRLGGFYNKEQLKEVYGIDTAKYREIKDQLTVDKSKVIKININTISFASLRQCPYLSYKQASAIIEFRSQHGKYLAIGDIGNIVIITPDILKKIEPYLNYQ
jgi:competence ComEA-like helix-hairpin-helix protein